MIIESRTDDSSQSKDNPLSTEVLWHDEIGHEKRIEIGENAEQFK
jgi:hypothetical protein